MYSGLIECNSYNFMMNAGRGLVAIICALFLSIPEQLSAMPMGAECNRPGPKELMHGCEASIGSNKVEEEKVFKYPAVTPLFDIPGYSGRLRAPFFLSSSDGTKISFYYTKDQYGIPKITKSTPQLLELESKQIISWKAFFLGKDNTAAVAALVGGALAFWPMMLAAPYLVHDINGFEISYIDGYGTESTISFASTVRRYDLHLEFFENTTGLKMGEIRDTSELQDLYKAGLFNLTTRHLAAQAKIYQIDSRKPWCTVLSPSASPEDKKTYEKVDRELSKLRKKLGMTEIEPNQGVTISAGWDKYLMKNENFSKWVNANPTQAMKLKECK